MTELAIQGITLPGIPQAADPVMQLTAAWLMAQRSPNTMLAYSRDILGVGRDGKAASLDVAAWLPWLARHGIHPFAARRGHVDTYSKLLGAAGSSPSTVLRKISAISSWYTYMIREDATEVNPAQWATRPIVDQHVSSTTGLSESEALMITDAADSSSLRTSAIIRSLLYGGWRVSLISTARLSDLGHDRGHRTIRVTLKGGKVIKAPLAEPVYSALDAYIASRGAQAPDSLVFVTSTGKSLTEPAIWRLVRTVAKNAGIPSWNELSPHSLRHTFATLAFEYGVPLADIQDAMGHTSAATTRRYDRARFRLDSHPTYVLADRLAAARKIRG